MFRDKVVFLLGAGASAPYGYPIGPQLISSIAAGLCELRTDRSWALSIEDYNCLKSPSWAAYNIAMEKRPAWIHSNFYTGGVHTWRELGKRLENDPSPSIDEFARANPTQSGAIKLLIAAEIIRHTYDPDANRNFLAPSPQLLSNTRNHWYGKLVAQLRRHYRDGESFDPDNPLSVVTFNYDKSLELFLHHEMARAEKYKGVKAEDVVNIIHVHGEVNCESVMDGRDPVIHMMEAALASAETMSVVDDPRGRNDPALVARTMLREADHIVALGFDFHEQNVELLNMNRSGSGSRMRALNFSGSRGFALRAAKAGVQDIWAREGEWQITQAIDDGLFEG